MDAFLARSSTADNDPGVCKHTRKLVWALYLSAPRCGTSFQARKQFELVELPFCNARHLSYHICVRGRSRLMASFQGNQSTAKGPLGASGTGAEPSAVGQVAMATDHGGRRGAPTDTSGQSRDGRTCRAAGNGGKRAASGPDASTGKGKASEEGNAAPYGMRNVQSDWL